MLVEFAANSETATYQWQYKGGCFESNQVAHYTPASMGSDYTFEKVPIEVREYRASLAEQAFSVFSFAGLMYFLGVLSLLGAIAVVYFLFFKE